MQVVAELRHLLRGARFRQLFAVRVTSQAFDGVFQVGLASYVLFSPEDRPDAAAIAAGLAALLLPFSLLGPFVGVFLDRWSRRQVLFYGNLLRVVPVTVLAGLIAAGIRGGWLFAIVLVALSVNRFLLAGLSAGLPHVVAPGELVMANSLTPTCGTIAFMIGLGLASVGRALLPLDQPDVVVVLVSAVGYAGAALLARRMPTDLLGPDLESDRPHVREALGDVVRGMVDGLQHLRRRPQAAAALGAIGAHRFLYGLTTVATVLLYRNTFHDPGDTDAALAGLAEAVLVTGLGFFAAAVVTPIATDRMPPRRWIVTLFVLAAVVVVVPGALYTEWAVLLAAFGLGLSAQGVKICVDTLVQLWVDDGYRGRVFALYDVIFNVVFVAAAAVGAFVIPVSGRSYALLLAVSAGYAATAVGYVAAGRIPPEPLGQSAPSRVGHQASSASRARSSPMGPWSRRRSSRNR
jgi:MFS family permease